MTSPHLPPVLRHIRKLMGAPDVAELTDAQLVDRFIAQREEAAFEALFERHAPMVLGVCRRLLNEPADVEDAFQATFLVLARKADSVTRRDSLGSWLYGVAYRIALKARGNAALRRTREREAAAMTTGYAMGSPEVPDLKPVVDEEVQRLPAKYRLPVVLCYLEGKTNEEAARQLRCPAGTVKTRLAKGRELLRNRLTRRGLALSAAAMGPALSANLAPAAVPSLMGITTCHAALLGAAGQTGAVSASALTLAEGAIRTMLWSKIKLGLVAGLVTAVMIGGAGWFGFRTLAARPGEESADQAVPPVALPLDNGAVVLSWDRERPDLPRHGDEPRLTVRANGLVSVRDPYGSDEPAQERLTGPQLQGLLRHAVHENGFFDLNERHLRELGPASATTVLQISADGKDQTIRCPVAAKNAAASDQARRLAAIEDRLERLALWVAAGGDAGLAAALQAANEQLLRQFPEAPPFTAEDLHFAVRRPGGQTELAFERRRVSVDRNPFSFTYARVERLAGGEPRVTVKASLAAAAANPKKKTGPLDVQPKPIASDPAVKYDYDIVYVRSPRKGDDKQIRWTEVFAPLRAEPGADLMILHPDGKEEVLVPGNDGPITDPFVSFDAESVYYAKFNPPNSPPGSDVYKVHVKTRKIVKLTEQVFTPNAGIAVPGRKPAIGVFNLGPCPLPGGKVMFTSNRNGYSPTKGYTPSVLQLFTMDDDGGNVELIGHLNINSALHPTILKDGRVMFTSYESQGLRDLRNWSVWTIHPDGTNWGPLFSGFLGTQALHFMTQISDGSVVVEEYYNLNNQGFGTFYKMAPSASPGEPYFGSASRRDPRNIGYQGSDYYRIPFSPHGIQLLTTFCDGFDRMAKLSDPKEPNSPRVGKVTHPSGAPDNHLLMVWSPGPVNSNAGVKKPAIDGGIYLLKSGLPVDEPGQMLVIKNDPNYNEQWPRALVPYKRIHGIDEPARLPSLKNDGKLHKALPEGTPFGMVGTSSMYKRESYPGGGVAPNGVTAGPDPSSKDPFQGQGALAYNPAEVNWFIQGSDAGRYTNSDVHAVRILVTEPTTDPRNTAHHNIRFWNIAQERLRILGEFPVRKFKDGKQPPDPDGNPDTSFLVKIPGNLAWTFQTLDRNGMVLNMAQTWHQLRPGEVRTDCGGCHAHSQKPTEFKLTAAARPDYPVWDLTAKTPLLTTKKHDESNKQWDVENGTGIRWAKGVLNVEYYRDVKPIFERSCVACHTEKSGSPAGNLVLDDDGLVQGPPSFGGLANGPFGKVPGTFARLVIDPKGKFGHLSPLRNGWSHPQASRYVRFFQSRRSLLIWKVFGRRLDGWRNEDFITEATPGDLKSMVHQGKPVALTEQNSRLFNLAYTGSVMPPPEAVAGIYEGSDGKKIKVAPLSDEDKLTLVRWIDLGCPIDLSFDPAKPQAPGVNGWTLHDNRPTLTLTHPEAGPNPALARLLVGMTDYYTGLDMDTFQVTADFTVDGVAAGENLASKFKPAGQGIWERKLATPITELRQGVLTVSVKNRQGNLSEIKRRFSVRTSRAQH